MSRMSGVTPPPLHMPAWSAHGQLRRCFQVGRGKEMGSEMGGAVRYKALTETYRVPALGLRTAFNYMPNLFKFRAVSSC